MSSSEYHAATLAVDQRARAIMETNLGNLAPSSPAWKDILMLRYMGSYLARPAVKAAILANR